MARTRLAPRTAAHWSLVLSALLLLVSPDTAPADWTSNGDPLRTGLDYVPGSQHLVTDGSGGVIAIWELGQFMYDTPGRGQKIDRYGHQAWTANGLDLGAPVTRLDAISDGAGGVIVVGHIQIIGGLRGTDIFAQRYDGAGAPLWGPSGVIVCSADYQQTDPRVISDGTGGALVFWSDERQSQLNWPNVYGQRLTASGTPLWTSNGNLVGDPAGYIAYFSVVSDGQGGAVVMGDPQGTEVYLQRMDPAGNRLWPPAGIPFAPSNYFGGATLVPAGDGGVIVGWLGWDQADALMAQRFDADGVARWPGDGARFSTVPGQQDYDFEGDGAGGVWAAWADSRVGYYRSIFAQHLDGSGARLLADAAVEVHTDINTRGLPNLCLDGQGGVLISWTDFRDVAIPGRSNDVYAQRLSATGAKLWASQGLEIAALEGFQDVSTPYPDGTGGAFICWSDTRVSHQNALYQGDLYVTRVSGGGAVAAVPTPVREPGRFPVQLAPNPTRGKIWLMTTGVAAGPATLSLFDPAGRRLLRRTLELVGGGEQRIALDLAGLDGQALPAGTYFYRLEAGGAAATGKLVVRP